MITFKTGNILDSSAEALVNTVNTMGVMGKGIALQFKNAFPDNTKAYLNATKNKELVTGKVLIVAVASMHGTKYIINFPTKAHWRFPSRISWIKEGLEDLKIQLRKYEIKSVALPPLGCGNGGLDWNEVRPLIEAALADLNVDIVVYEPSAAVRELLKKEEVKKSSRLTPARAMLLHMLYRYRALGEFASEFAAEKLSYFLQRSGETQFKLDFHKGVYGPYSGKVRHVLYALNGYYLKGYEQKDTKPFEALELVMEKRQEVEEYLTSTLSPSEMERLRKVTALIEGYESPYGLELLATVDFVKEEKRIEDASLIQQEMWTERKQKMFQPEHIAAANARLQEYFQ